jgi:hypothetical protein
MLAQASALISTIEEPAFTVKLANDRKPLNIVS